MFGANMVRSCLRHNFLTTAIGSAAEAWSGGSRVRCRRGARDSHNRPFLADPRLHIPGRGPRWQSFANQLHLPCEEGITSDQEESGTALGKHFFAPSAGGVQSMRASDTAKDRTYRAAPREFCTLSDTSGRNERRKCFFLEVKSFE